DEITGTRGRSNKEAIAQGLANITSGFFSGMGGCALIGQSLINISAGARARLSAIIASCMLLIFVVFFSGLIEKIPMAALTGLMIMVAAGTFQWASIRMIGKMPGQDIFVGILVAGITVWLQNLALAVLIGVVISALVFAWESAKRISAKKFVDENNVKHYELFGPLFFASVARFNTLFDVAGDPENVIIDFRDSRVADMSGIEALNKLTEKYRSRNKILRLRHLSPDSVTLLNNASSIIEVNIIEDPSYKVVINEL
ncbi:MAG: SulP family inorganic anion transporter, partial [Sphingobacteriales bacterium]